MLVKSNLLIIETRYISGNLAAVGHEKLGNINFVHVVSSLGERLTISSTLHHSIGSGKSVGVRLSQDDYFIFDRETGARVLA